MQVDKQKGTKKTGFVDHHNEEVYIYFGKQVKINVSILHCIRVNIKIQVCFE